MTNMRLLLATVFLFSITACNGSAGAQGPAGPQGPPGILWDELDKTKIAAIPELIRREKLRPDRGNSAHPHD